MAPPGPEVERLPGTVLVPVAPDDPEQGVGHPVDRHRADEPVDESRIRPERAAQADIDGFFDVLVDVRDVASEADVGDLRLGTRGGATREVHADDPRVAVLAVCAILRQLRRRGPVPT